MNRGSATLVALLAATLLLASARAETPPRVLDDRLELTLVAREPDVVTPIGLVFDHRGRLLVIESHTHFPPNDYAGPPHDRIQILEDTTGDGTADRVGTFYEGSHDTMSIARGPRDWIYVATRMRLFRLRDTTGDGRADEEETLARLVTEGNYPHNGLCGLWYDDRETLYFGLGENLGVDYTLVGRDGARLRGGGEGGSIYRCRDDGARVERVATGFWNPFGICLDPHDRLLTVDNDPDASPPCRLLHVVQGGDYGYQFRYGRSGKHPLQAWDGELPGTLPMLAATSEAPSAVLPYHGQLYVTCWGENRIERFALQPHGASFTATREVVVQGDYHFRPVDFAVAPDGSLYFTDWVDRSYHVHGQGRVWRLRWKTSPPDDTFPPRTPGEREAQRLATADDGAMLLSSAELSSDADPFLRHAAVSGLVDSPVVHGQDLHALDDDRQRLGLLEAARRSALSEARREALLTAALDTPSDDVRLYAARWIADDGLTAHRDALADLLATDDVSLRLFRGVLAAVDWLDTGQLPPRGRPIGEAFLLAAWEDEMRPVAIRTLAMRLLGPEHPALGVEPLYEQSRASQPALQREAVRLLVLGTAPERMERLLQLARDDTLDSALRADALAGVPLNEKTRTTFEGLAAAPDDAVRHTAARRLRGAGETAESLPDAADTDAWVERIGPLGDRDAGWRVFFGRGNVRCADCHTCDGQGADVGPDLTGIVGRIGRRRVLESVLQPSREIAPRYVPWIVETTAGEVFVGHSLGVHGSGLVEEFLLADGTQREIDRDQIAARQLSDRSIMPDGLDRQLSAGELRDLLALLGDE